MLNQASSIFISTESYIKVIVLKLDDFESRIVDEKNFGLFDIDIEDFIAYYKIRGLICHKYNINCHQNEEVSTNA
jgi:hypothetical protein